MIKINNTVLSVILFILTYAEAFAWICTKTERLPIGLQVYKEEVDTKTFFLTKLVPPNFYDLIPQQHFVIHKTSGITNKVHHSSRCAISLSL